MKVLLACEESGECREAFAALGHDAWSCDLVPSARPSRKHIQADVLTVLNDSYAWDLMIGFPPCTYTCFAGMRWNVNNPERQRLTFRALMFFCLLLDSPSVERVALENPVGVIPRYVRKWDQMIHPWQFGHGEEKKTCLWLRSTPPSRQPGSSPVESSARSRWRRGRIGRATAPGHIRVSPAPWRNSGVTYE